jgi:ethanolamine utilization protein EutN
MFLGRVVGNAVVTVKSEGLHGFPLLVVQPLDHHQKPKGAPIIVLDRIGVGPGEVVMLETSREATLGLRHPLVPTDVAIVARVDSMLVEA